VAAKEFRERLAEEYRKAREEMNQIRKDVSQWGAASAVGLTSATVAGAASKSLTGTMDLKLALLTAGLATVGPIIGQAVTQTFGRKNREQKFRATVPMSVFVDLSEDRPKPPERMSLSGSQVNLALLCHEPVWSHADCHI
jgi:hypothetical protein